MRHPPVCIFTHRKVKVPFLRSFRSVHRFFLSLILLPIGLLGTSVQVATALSITATSSEGTLDWQDPSIWTFGLPPSTATFPDNDSVDFFSVRIDGGASSSTEMSLSTNVAVDRLEIGLGDSLVIADATELTLDSDPSRAGSGQLVNNGLIEVGGLLGGSSLRLAGDVTMSGNGILRLADFTSSRLSFADGAGEVALRNEVGHRIEGAGIIDVARLENRGTIAVNGNGWMSLSSHSLGFVQQGTLEVTGSGALFMSTTQFTNEGTIRTTNGLIRFGQLTNVGLVELLAGRSTATSRTLRGPLIINDTTGVFRVAGTGTLLTARSFQNDGLFEVSDSARLIVIDQLTGTGDLRIATGATVTARFGFTSGTLELDSGTLIGPSSMRLNTLTGTGSVQGTGLIRTTLAAPGIDGIGALDFVGSSLITNYQADLGGPLASDYDRLTASENLTFQRSIDVSLANGFLPELGNRFDIASASGIDFSLSSSSSLDTLLTLPALADNLLWNPEVADTATGQALRLNLAQSVRATTNAGGGDYFDPLSWSFDAIPFGTSAPANDAFNLFRVEIDGGVSGSDAAIVLSGNATVESLAISSGDSLSIEGGGSLAIVSNPFRPTADPLINNGTLTVSSFGVSSALRSNRDLRLAGPGAVVLAGDGTSLISIASDGGTEPLALVNELDHRIEGGGRVEASRITNRGTILANGSAPLTLAADVYDLGGTYEATGDGNLVFEGTAPLGPELIRASDGGRIDIDTLGFADRVSITGPGSQLDVSGLLRIGTLFEIDDGGLATTNGFSQTRGLLHIGQSAELRFAGPGNAFLGGVLELDGGTVTSPGDLNIGLFQTSSVSLEGTGSFALPGNTLSIINSGRDRGHLSPGILGAGLIDVDGSLELDTSLLVDLGGSAPSQYDRIVATEGVNIRGGSIAISTIDGFVPSGGDVFDLVTGFNVTSEVAVDSLFGTLPSLEGIGEFWVKEITNSTGMQSLRLLVETTRRALWSGGDGNYDDPAQWSFDAPPVSVAIPENTDRDKFNVVIDGSESGTPGTLSLGRNITIDSLQVGVADRFVIEGGGSLTIDNDPARGGNGTIVNNGEIVLDGSTGIASLNNVRELSLSGTGTLRMTGAAQINPPNAPNSPSATTNNAGHHIEGSGTIAQGIINFGTISANSADPLWLSGRRLEQRGLLEATGTGGLEISASFNFDNFGTIRSSSSSITLESVNNEGLIEVTNGGRIVVTSSIANWSPGQVRVSGPGSSISVDAYFGGGLFEVLDGGRAEIGSFSGAGITRIDRNSLLESTRSARLSGILDLDGGTFRSVGGFLVNSFGRVEGSGLIDLGTRELRLELAGALAPGGRNGIGTLDIVGDVFVSNNFNFGRSGIEIQLGGDSQGEFDMISIEGTLSIMGSILVDLIDLDDPTNPTNLYDPAIGSTFDVIVAQNIVDLGGSFVLPTFDDGRTFTQSVVHVGSVDVLRLMVIPEPTTAVLLALGIVVLASTKERR